MWRGKKKGLSMVTIGNCNIYYLLNNGRQDGGNRDRKPRNTNPEKTRKRKTR